MPKSKKAKTSHRERPMTQAEIWDDSALIRSWDEAVKEYEFYHSIHAKGEDVDEVLRQAEMEEEEEHGETVEGVGRDEKRLSGLDGVGARKYGAADRVEEGEEGDDDDDVEDGEVEEGEARSDEIMSGINGKQTGDALRPGSSHPLRGLQSGNLPLPTDSGAATAHAPTEDQTLENVKMAYWWAGYYSGLYEGQKQAGQR